MFSYSEQDMSKYLGLLSLRKCHVPLYIYFLSVILPNQLVLRNKYLITFFVHTIYISISLYLPCVKEVNDIYVYSIFLSFMDISRKRERVCLPTFSM